MIEGVLKDKEQGVQIKKPYLSFSRINRYLLCPEQYRLYYRENLRLRIQPASLVFGKIVHQALAVLLQNQEDPVKFFQTIWQEVKQVDLTYNQKESWEKLNSSGEGLLEKFLREEFPRLDQIRGVEKPFEINISNLDLPFVGVIDLVADVGGKATVVDFKTSGSAYEGHEAALSDQLTAYQLAEPGVEQTALCVLIKTKEPKIEWHLGQRSPETVMEFLDKVEYVAHEISTSRFYKRPGNWCGYCDYLPVCLKDNKTAEETLVRVA